MRIFPSQKIRTKRNLDLLCVLERHRKAMARARERGDFLRSYYLPKACDRLLIIVTTKNS